MLDTHTSTPVTTHTVKSGDTWARISSCYHPDGTTPDLYTDYIRLLNGGKLTKGRTILV